MSSRLGAKVRGLRRKEGLTQAQLAERLGISTSYINLIEHNRRPLTAPLLIKLATLFDLDLQSFADDSDDRLAGELMEVFADPVFESHDLLASEVREVVAQAPAVGRAIVELYAAFTKAQRNPSAPATPAAKSPAEAVSDLIHREQNYFGPIEAAAERLRADAGLGRSAIDGDLVAYLERAHQMAVRIEPSEAMGHALRRYTPKTRTLALSEALPPQSRAFQIAHVAGLTVASDALDALIDAKDLAASARPLARVVLANYFAAAVMMPYERFLNDARALRYDVERLGHRYHAGFEQVCHRLTSLNRDGARGVPFHLVRVDIAGNISKRFGGSGISIARFSGACPRWNVHAAFMTPGRIRTQVSRMPPTEHDPDGPVYVCIARTVSRAGAGYRDAHVIHAVGLGCRVEHADQLVYADRINLNHAVPVGSTCRLCPRADCAHRAMPRLKDPQEVHEGVRGLSFYGPAR